MMFLFCYGCYGCIFWVLYLKHMCYQMQHLNFIFELNTPVVLKLVLRYHLGPQTCKIEIWLPELVKLCHLGPYLLRWRHVA